MDGDEMTRIIWSLIKEKLIMPHVDLKSVYFDLGLPNREKTHDEVTREAARAALEYGVAVKCATITPNAQRVEEYNLSEMYPSPNATIRGIMDGTVFRAPILIDSIKPYVRTWKKPITIARHAYGDIYTAKEAVVYNNVRADLVITNTEGESGSQKIFTFNENGGIVMGMYNTFDSMKSFARSCFEYALSERKDLWFSAKDTISKKYDHSFKDVFQEIYDEEYSERFTENGIKYFYTLIDDAVARVIRSEGGFIWALKNYDGDVMSDMLATAFGSLAMMTSVLVTPRGQYEFEAAHGTVTRHYYKHLKGEATSTNSVATIFAWTGALRKRGEMDGLTDLCEFAGALEQACYNVIDGGIMTKDLAQLSDLPEKKEVSTEAFIDFVAGELDKIIS
jgi:isocitrate dehydrogenase